MEFNGNLFLQETTPPPTIDKSLYYSGSITGGVVNPAYATGGSPYKRFTSPYKRKHDPDKISDESMFDEDYNEDDEYYLWDRNHDSGLVSAVSMMKML